MGPFIYQASSGHSSSSPKKPSARGLRQEAPFVTGILASCVRALNSLFPRMLVPLPSLSWGDAIPEASRSLQWLRFLEGASPNPVFLAAMATTLPLPAQFWACWGLAHPLLTTCGRAGRWTQMNTVPWRLCLRSPCPSPREAPPSAGAEEHLLCRVVLGSPKPPTCQITKWIILFSLQGAK